MTRGAGGVEWSRPTLAGFLSVDPGANPGFAEWTLDGRLVRSGYRPEDFGTDAAPYAEVVFEAQHSAASLYRNGRRVPIRRKSQMTLSFTAGRLFERFRAERKYRILPDDWRAVLWPGSRRLPKAVVLARLEAEYGDLVVDVPKTHRGDVVEAVGIGVAWSRLTQKQKERFRVE